jgi:excisionase family DNA binding protein
MAEKQVLTGKAELVAATLLEKELAEALGIPLGTVRRLRYEDKIPYVMIGRGRPIYLAESIIAWLKRKEVSNSYAKAAKTPAEGPKTFLSTSTDGFPKPSILG